MFSIWSQIDGIRQISRRTFLAVYQFLVLITGTLVSLIPSSGYDKRGIMAASALIFLMLPLSRVRVPGLFRVLFHSTTALAVFMVLYTAAFTGGINSNAMVWINVLVVPVLFLYGPRQTLIWIGLIELSTAGIMLATQQGWVSSHANLSVYGVPWALLNQMMALFNLMFAVHVYDHMHRLQLHELERRNVDLRATYQALKQAQAHKDEFVAAVSHELRTPMNAMLGLNGVLRNELADRPQDVEVVDHIRRSTDHLLQVVNEILDFSQLQARKVKLYPQDFDLHAALRGLMDKHAPKARDKGLAWQIKWGEGVTQHVHMDRQRLLQVLSLMLDNAIKFTAQGQVLLRVNQIGDRLRCEVQDTGRGIAPERQAQIFKGFEYADVQTNRTYGGTGLGLTICDQLVHLMGGEIGLHSVPDQGALFWFEVPLRAALGTTTAQNEHDIELAPYQALDILVVDDNPVNLMVARLQLQKTWPLAHITTAESAVHALQLLQTQVFDVALVDMVMPEMDGLDLTRAIQQRMSSQLACMPIIALTANTNPHEIERCLAAGMHDVLLKPMDTDLLVRSVNQQIRRLRSNA
jgi:signal transduction histidine kinase/ActR/RegA family two-component response regulator